MIALRSSGEKYGRVQRFCAGSGLLAASAADADSMANSVRCRYTALEDRGPLAPASSASCRDSSFGVSGGNQKNLATPMTPRTAGKTSTETKRMPNGEMKWTIRYRVGPL